MQSPLLPRYLIGYLTRETMLLEFSSTIVSLILAGKIGSNIASEIGSMRINHQRSQDLRSHQIRNRIDSHGFQSFYLLGNPHTPDLGSDITTDFTG